MFGGGGPPGNGGSGSGNGNPGMAARGRGEVWKKKSGQAPGRGQWPPSVSSSNASHTTAWQACNGSGGSSLPLRNYGTQPSDRRPAAGDNRGPSSQTYLRENPVVWPALANGSQLSSRSHPYGPESNKDDVPSSSFDPEDSSEVEDLSDDDIDDDMSEETDSDESEKSFETRKKNKWFKKFFELIDTLNEEQIHDQTRPWHCPACQNGPGAIDWFNGLQSLVRHARTKGSRRVKLHREFATLLEQELGTTLLPPGEQFGKWEGLRGSTDREIVWPPMVIVMNTLLEQDNDDKWLGMGNEELLEYFHEYDAIKARHAYGPGGHRGMSVLIFESSAVGYMEAERLHKHFVGERTDREAWQAPSERRFLPGGKRLLYGFLANKEDMEIFNKHHPGKSCLKYDMRSYNEMVVVGMKQMSLDNQRLNHMKNRVVKTEKHSKAVEESLGVVTQKCRETSEENKVLMRRIKEKHLEHEEEMTSQEKFFNDQIENLYKAMEEKESEYEERLQEERAKARQYDVDSGTTENRRLRKEEVQRFIDCQAKGVEEFMSKRDELLKAHEKRKVQLKREYMEKEVELEKELDAALTVLMEKHEPDTFKASSSSL
nr:protein SUPPRESSOR OF GENE SILENCING 3 homolog [Aegilops tauschii subsp. strangulata]